MKYILTIISIIVVYICIGNVASQNNIIPKDAIRVRVISNSNSEYDQNIKYRVSDIVKRDMYDLLKNTNGNETAKLIINNNIKYLSDDISKYLNTENYNYNFDINYGLNYFPKKEYKGIIYKEGYYESLVVTLGKGEGDNWWCVLFPPLCLVESEESTDIEYTTFVKELMNKYL